MGSAISPLATRSGASSEPLRASVGAHSVPGRAPVAPGVRFGVVEGEGTMAPVLVTHVAAVELAHALEADLVARGAELVRHVALWSGST